MPTLIKNTEQEICLLLSDFKRSYHRVPKELYRKTVGYAVLRFNYRMLKLKLSTLREIGKCFGKGE
jgi:hypothetical protein